MTSKYGAAGPEVLKLQANLVRLGYEHVRVSGHFDVRTDEAVRHLQRSFGYDVDGTSSPACLALIEQQLGFRWNQQTSPQPLVVLTRGSKGEAVALAQAKLLAVGYSEVPHTAVFEAHTHEAVRHLQAAFGYVVDGVLGAATRFLLDQQSALGWNQRTTPVPLRSLTPGCEGPDVRELQEELRQLGYASCAATGVYDEATTAAVRALQEAFGYTIDGRAGAAVRGLVRQQLGYRWVRPSEAQHFGEAYWKNLDELPFVAKQKQFAPVPTQLYGHGAFMGAISALLADAKWRRILGFLMPDVFDALRAKVSEGADTSELVPMMENNPVMAAFGTVETARASGANEPANHLVGLEWDIFVAQDLIEASARAVTHEERAAVMDRVIDTALIAHGGALDTVLESAGICQYDDVRLRPKTEYGGVEMDSWLDLFGRALALARSEDLGGQLVAMSREARSKDQAACMVNTFAEPWAVERVVREYERVTGRAYLSVVLDIKSLNSTPSFLKDLVRHLNRFGVHVAGVGSFLREEIDGLASVEQRVGSLVLPGPKEVWFFHFAGDLQRACAEGRMPTGQWVLFNGASLLDESSSPRDHGYVAREGVVRGLEALRKKHGLHLGFYVQEGDCDGAAAGALSELAARWPETFELGFAWGGLRAEAGLLPEALGRRGHGSQSLLMLVGKAHDWSEPPEASPA